ncbi:hypothetical protein MICAF_1750003 [Microcystis aeruginosa PCC 9807]|uniref:Uncharacterized protein n=1 Tax=Microcystis aeruginosa PCC 9807 TaxID=1160283 RepID=I4H1Z1_MICAE|nr:hypothetical protein [Microcystis aeruginosa]CCI16065.1 hypothetical protein MICAF_1750003 [Microcystis aeruginosa PCC 9807]
MAAVASTVVKESAEELTQQTKEATTPREKDKLRVLYWLKQKSSHHQGDSGSDPIVVA